jgi:hypothetical protein
MIISDGTTDLTYEYSDESINPVIERSNKRTAGGNMRTVTGGERLTVSTTFRTTGTGYRNLINLLNNNADNYFFTPQDSDKQYWSDLYPDITFPINATFSNITRTWDNRSKWWVSMEVQSTSYV